MRSRAESALRLATAGLVAAGYAALAATPLYNGLMLVIPLLVLPLVRMGERLDASYSAYRRLTTALDVLFLFVLPVSFVVVGLYDTVVILVIYIQWRLLLHRKEERHYHYIFLMAFFMLLAACARNPDPVVAWVLLLFLVSAIAGMLALQLYAETRRAGGRGPAEVVAQGGRPLTASGEARSSRLGLVAPTCGLTLVSLALTVLFFLLTPRMHAGVLGRSTGGSSTVTGLDGQINLSRGGVLRVNPTMAMRVWFPELPGGQYDGPMFWRATSLSRYQKNTWEQMESTIAATDDAPRLSFWKESYDALQRSPGWNSRLVHQKITMEAVPEEGVPALSLVRRLTAPGKRIRWDGRQDGTVELQAGQDRKLVYEAWSEVSAPPAEELRKAPRDYRDVFPSWAYVVLTRHDLLPATRQRIREVTEGRESVYDVVTAVESWLNSGEFTYSLVSPRLPANHPVDSFLNTTKLGSCELFASSMALILRSLGVPARVVSGFRGGEWNEEEEGYTITADMAHLWVEVYFVNYGWIPFDPSPGEDELNVTTMGGLQNLIARQILLSRIFWYRNIIRYNQGFVLSGLRNLQVGLFKLPSDLRDAAGVTGVSGIGTLWPRLLAACLFVGGLVAALAFVVQGRTVKRDRRWPLSRDQVRAVRLYGQLRRRMKARGVDCEGMTAEELGERAEEHGLFDTAAVQEIIAAYNAVRFGGRPLSADRFAALRVRMRTLARGRA